jgi:hypothetical protein
MKKAFLWILGTICLSFFAVFIYLALLGNQYRVVRILTKDPEPDGMISVIGSTGQWLLINSIYLADLENPEVSVRGWVYAPLFKTRTQEVTTVKVWRTPSHKSTVVAKLPGGVGATVTGCCGDWVRVRHPKAAGWLDAESQCGNPFTTCP